MPVSHRAIDVSLAFLAACSCLAALLVVEPVDVSAQESPEMPQKAPEAREESVEPQTEVPVETPDIGVPGVPFRNHRDITTDSQLAETLGQVFGEVDKFQGIEVSVTDGVVHLEGTAQTASTRMAAEALAARFGHTLYVDNQIEVDDAPAPAEAPAERSIQDEAVQERLATIFSRVDELNDVQVEVQSGVVHLTGQTVSPDAVAQAEMLAGQLEGVAYVDNDIEVLREVGERLSPALQTARDKIVEFVQYLPLFAVALLILALFGGLASLVSRFDLPGERFERQPFLQNLVQQIIAVVIFSVGVVFVLELFQVTTLVGAVLGTAGVAGLAVGLAFRDIGENYLAGLWLGLQQPFEKNELVEIGEYHGKVVRLTTRATVLMTLDGNHIRIPNSTVFKEPLANYTRNPLRRFGLQVGIGTDEDLVEAQQIGLEMLRKANAVLDDPEPFASVDEFGDAGVAVTYYGWVDQRQYDWRRVRSEALRHLKGVLDAEGVEMPEKTYRVLTADLESHRQQEPERRERAAHELEQPVSKLEPSPEIDDQIEEDRARSEESDLLSS